MTETLTAWKVTVYGSQGGDIYRNKKDAERAQKLLSSGWPQGAVTIEEIETTEEKITPLDPYNKPVIDPFSRSDLGRWLHEEDLLRMLPAIPISSIYRRSHSIVASFRWRHGSAPCRTR